MLASVLFVVVLFGPFVAWLVWRGHGYKRQLLDRPPGAEWQVSAEAFVDPASGEVAQVWTHPASGRRAYVRRGRAGPVD